MSGDGVRTTVGVDVGGTFTDAILHRSGVTEVASKVPTTDPPTAGVIEAIERVCDSADIDPKEIDRFSHGSTVATNGLLEREGAKTALVTTAGFEDVLEIGRQDRSALYDLSASRVSPLIDRQHRIGLRERTPPPTHPAPEEVRLTPSQSDVDALVDDLPPVEAVAVSLLHADVDSQHEEVVSSTLSEALDIPIITSSTIDPTVREFERTATTTASAYLTPVLATYLDRLSDACDSLGIPEPTIMQSNGGVSNIEQVIDRAVGAVLSGPAAGVVGAASVVESAAMVERPGYISLDMGGTSTDVCLIEGTPHRTTETVVGDIPIRVPSIDINTVGAGGGSIAWVDEGGALRVGPDSAGSEPGPACYDRGGTAPTVTDAAVVLGIIGEDRTLGRELDIVPQRSVSALDALASEADLESATTAASGVYRVATETMVQAIRHITIERGHDPRGDALIAFGGAGGMHACAVASQLDLETVVIPSHAGLLSAGGLITGDERHDVATGCHFSLDGDVEARLEAIFAELEATATDRCEMDQPTLHRSADLRYRGQSYELSVPIDQELDIDAIHDRFEDRHRARRGYTIDDRIDVIACRVEAIVPTEHEVIEDERGPWQVTGTRSVTIPPHPRQGYTIVTGIPPVGAISPPAILEQPNTTIIIPPEWVVTATSPAVILEREVSR